MPLNKLCKAWRLWQRGYRPWNGGIIHRTVDRIGQVEVGRGVKIQRGVVLDAGFGGTICLRDRVSLCLGTSLTTAGGDIDFGDGSFTNSYCVVLAAGPVRIGRGVMFGPHVVIAAGNHGMDGRRPIVEQPMTGVGITIEDDVWIGAHATITDGVTVREGTVVAAGAVVTRDTPPYSVVAGVPAKVIRYREGHEPLHAALKSGVP